MLKYLASKHSAPNCLGAKTAHVGSTPKRLVGDKTSGNNDETFAAYLTNPEVKLETRSYPHSMLPSVHAVVYDGSK